MTQKQKSAYLRESAKQSIMNGIAEIKSWDKTTKQFDAVNRPKHYSDGKIEAIDFFEDKLEPLEFQGFLKGNAMKYMVRAGKKTDNPLEDLKKAQWYINKLIATLEKE